MQKKILIFCTTVLMAALMSVSAFAAESSFDDVPADAPWAESISYLAEKGITNGTGIKTFSPGNPVTVRQWAVMLCRAYGLNMKGETWNEFSQNSIEQAYHKGWLNVTAVTSPDTKMCRAALLESGFSAAGMALYDPCLYPDGENVSAADHILQTGQDLGLCTEWAAAEQIVTRADAAQLLHALLTQNFLIQEPPAPVTLENRANINTNDYLLELHRVPASVLVAFNERVWKYVIDFEYMASLSKKLGMSCIGATSYADKAIYISSASATLHEFGHFLDKVLDDSTEWERLYQAEAGGSILRDYAKTNSREYFADCFAYWITYSDSAKHMELFWNTTPQTYAYMEKLAESNWGC